MGNRGPSPLVPSLMVGALGLIVFGPMLMTLMEYVLPLFQWQAGGEDVAFSFAVVLPLLLIVLVHLISASCPRFGTCFASGYQAVSSGSDADGYGLGTLLLVVLFFILYNIW